MDGLRKQRELDERDLAIMRGVQAGEIGRIAKTSERRQRRRAG